MVDQDEKFFKSSRRQDSVSSRLTTQTLSLPMFHWIGYFLCCYLAADLLAGFWHWWGRPVRRCALAAGRRLDRQTE